MKNWFVDERNGRNLLMCKEIFQIISVFVRIILSQNASGKRSLLVHGAISTIKRHHKSSFAPVIKCHKDKVEIYRPALEGNLSRKYSFSKSINYLGVSFKLACNPKKHAVNLSTICHWSQKFSIPQAKIVFWEVRTLFFSIKLIFHRRLFPSIEERHDFGYTTINCRTTSNS